MTKSIEIIINPQGQTTFQTKGFAGVSRQDASKFLEEALGQRLAEQRTAEFYQQAAPQVQQQQRS